MSVAAGGQDVGSQTRALRRLETELALAKTGAFYLVLHIESKSLELKARGLTLRGWTIGEFAQSGRRPSEGVLTIVKKAAPFVPTRSKIKPEKEDEAQPAQAEPAKPATGEYDLQALEVHDMPGRFDLMLDSGLTIRCEPKKQGVSSFLDKAARALVLPLKNLIHSLKQKSFSLLELGFEDKLETQSIYWTAFEGQKIILLNN
jgi:hypothetical protein